MPAVEEKSPFLTRSQAAARYGVGLRGRSIVGFAKDDFLKFR
jgi:hypothetical protein